VTSGAVGGEDLFASGNVSFRLGKRRVGREGRRRRRTRRRRRRWAQRRWTTSARRRRTATSTRRIITTRRATARRRRRKERANTIIQSFNHSIIHTIIQEREREREQASLLPAGFAGAFAALAMRGVRRREAAINPMLWKSLLFIDLLEGRTLFSSFSWSLFLNMERGGRREFLPREREGEEEDEEEALLLLLLARIILALCNWWVGRVKAEAGEERRERRKKMERSMLLLFIIPTELMFTSKLLVIVWS
jgi:hypothetical protein